MTCTEAHRIRWEAIRDAMRTLVLAAGEGMNAEAQSRWYYGHAEKVLAELDREEAEEGPCICRRCATERGIVLPARVMETRLEAGAGRGEER